MRARDRCRCHVPDRSWLSLLAEVRFSGLASSLTIYFNSEYGLSPVTAGYFTAAAVFAGSLVRPVGGALADRVGGIRALSVMYIVAAVALAVVSLRLPQAWMALVVFVMGMLVLEWATDRCSNSCPNASAARSA